MKSYPISKQARGFLWLFLMVMALDLSKAADSLFGTQSSQQPTASSLASDTAAMADAAAAVSSAPPISAAPATASSLLDAPASSPLSSQPGSGTIQVPSPASQVGSPSTSTNSAVSGDTSTNSPVSKSDSTALAPVVTGKTDGVPTTVAPTIKPLPVDQPPNMDQPPDKMAATAPAPPSENVTLNLINRLVQRGILTKDDAGDLIRQAQDDAKSAAQQAQVTQQAATQAAAAQQMAVEAAAPPQSDDQVSVSYVPEIVKAEMKDEIKRDVMAAAQAEGWNQPNIPEWISKFRPFMDFRFRYEGDYFPSGNDTNVLSGNLWNFNAINTGSPYKVVALGLHPTTTIQNAPPPTYNTTQNRERLRIRFRFGADMNLGENFTSGFRIGTGQNGSPVSENQTLGQPGANNQGGDFSSYAIWLDRAFLKYEIGDNPDQMAAITFGRFDNPFYTPTTIMWANDIGFDGIAAQARYKVLKGFTPFATVGLFPIYNTDLNFASTVQPKFSSNDKYLYAGQVGIDWKVVKDLNFKGSVGYYYFQNAEGKVSQPTLIQPLQGQNQAFSTDDTRPSFAQHGNTYMELRDILDPTGSPGVNDQYQYYGLATPFQIFSANGRLEYRRWEPFVVSISGEWDQNMAWNASSIQDCGPSDTQNAYNIHGPINNIANNGQYQGGNNAWIAQFKIGAGALQKRWDWDFGLSYRYVESDAVIDGFCDSDFGGGGTNLKGWAVGGNLALSRNVFIGARWFNANSIAGPQINSNILQIDLNARF
jgi:hypothetical protein